MIERVAYQSDMNELIALIDDLMEATRVAQVKSEIKQRQDQIKKLPTKCGNCKYWMTSDCPKEKYTKVSMGMPICAKFEQDALAYKLAAQWESEIIVLQASL